MAEQPDLARAFGQQGLAYVDREYRWQRVREKLQDVLGL